MLYRIVSIKLSLAQHSSTNSVSFFSTSFSDSNSLNIPWPTFSKCRVVWICTIFLYFLPLSPCCPQGPRSEAQAERAQRRRWGGRRGRRGRPLLSADSTTPCRIESSRFHHCKGTRCNRSQTSAKQSEGEEDCKSKAPQQSEGCGIRVLHCEMFA